jgi:hypothetical protein
MYCTTSTSTGFWNKKKSRRPTLSSVMMKMEPTTMQVNGSRFSASLATPTRNSCNPKSIESSSMLIAAPLPTYWSRSCVDQEREITWLLYKTNEEGLCCAILQRPIHRCCQQKWEFLRIQCDSLQCYCRIRAAKLVKNCRTSRTSQQAKVLYLSV